MSEIKNLKSIRQLSPSVVNKIAAGEVIERPASVVKELLENAVDAGARRIDVSVEQGGAAAVRVSDDGCGIVPDQLALAVASHATSKITDADDLFRIDTLGFRGEALASIAEVSHFRLRSRVADGDAGYELEVTGGQLRDVAPCGCPPGTTVEVCNLFYNTPVRRKFLRTTQTEMGHASEAFTRIALAHPSIHFTLRHNERQLFDLPPTESWRERIVRFFGSELNDHLLWIESSDAASRLSGYVAAPDMSRSNNRLQYLFLNGRFIRDRALQHALGEAYRGLLTTGRYPLAFLKLEIAADTVDVNVHPTKLEVRFQDSSRIYSQLLGTLRSKFLSTDLTVKVALTPVAAASDLAESSADPSHLAQHRQQVSSWARGGQADVASDSQLVASKPAADQQSSLRFDSPGTRDQVPEFRPFPTTSNSAIGLRNLAPASVSPTSSIPVTQSPSAAAAVDDPPSDGWDRGTRSTSGNLEPMSQSPPAPSPASVPTGLQLHNRYLVTQSEDGMVVIDQHALHERILYEQLREKVLAGRLETQRLLVPEPVSLTSAEAAAALDASETLEQLGIEVTPFGGDTVLISSYPAMLTDTSPPEVLRQVVDLLLSGGQSPDRRDVLDELLHMISCKAAIKAGDRLSPAEVEALIEQRHCFQDTHHCPHGRPTALVFTRDELDKRFKRT